MSVNPLSTEQLIAEIEEVFPIQGMPAPSELILDAGECHECDELSDDLNLCRGKSVDRSVIALVHQALAHLSAKAWFWLLPYYLRFGASEEGSRSTELEFLIYYFALDTRFRSDIERSLSLLSLPQLSCLTDFLRWCSGERYWKDYAPDSITAALINLEAIRSSRQSEDSNE